VTGTFVSRSEKPNAAVLTAPSVFARASVRPGEFIARIYSAMKSSSGRNTGSNDRFGSAPSATKKEAAVQALAAHKPPQQKRSPLKVGTKHSTDKVSCQNKEPGESTSGDAEEICQTSTSFAALRLNCLVLHSP
jgi:hypothetical protein